MDNKKFERLIDLIINENEEKASELFHEIVVEKSRQIYENIMDEEMMDEEMMDEGDMDEGDMDEGGMHGQVGDLLDEISAEESGVVEGEGEDHHEFGMDDEDSAHDEIEDRVVRIEDKLDQLMAEFEEIMGDGEMPDHDEDHDEEDMDGEEDEEGEEGEEDEEGDEEDLDMDDEEEEDELDEAVMENINLPKVPAPKHGDDGAQKKSTVAANSGQRGMASKPVTFSGHAETVPTSPKKPHDAYTKGEGNLPGAGSFKNTPGKNNFTEKGSSTPKPVTKDGATGKRSPVAK